MKIPEFFERVIRLDRKLEAFTSLAISRISGYVASNRMVFFPEYTDHGISHIEQTLQTSLDLATARSRELMTTQDAAVLTVAVALHDFGMHLTRDGFETLIREDSHWKPVKEFDQTDWHTLWNEYYAEATRFDGRKLRSLFGESYRPVRPLPTAGLPWEEFDFLLVGEFLRRHHPRLAHEIALYGFPAINGQAIPICPIQSEEEQFLADISGLVARSHGMDLRPCLDYLTLKYANKINPRRTHVAFLATLLRIGDYFQIQANRAPTERTETTTFRSQFSDGEWKLHQAIKDIHNTGGDPEAITVIAEPLNVSTYLKIKSWTEGLQNELDRSWAILGETFGLQAHNQLSELGLRIRRLKSNLDDTPAFSKTIAYVPAQIAFEAANADLLKLLVTPLYGDDPGVGIRELLQNAVDSVREFEDLLRTTPKLESLDRYELEGDVLLHLHTDADNQLSEIVICDRGVGMTPDTVQNYFLKAGASFRRSDMWRRHHEDLQGKSRVLRTGRFGVGALAAFLIGDEIEVTTRHITAKEDEALVFTARLDDEAISLNRTTAPVGTKIRILSISQSKHRLQQLLSSNKGKINLYSSMGHYYLKDPSVVRVLPDGTKVEPEHWLPQPDAEVSEDWRWFSAEGFERIFWTYSSTYPRLACNGIVIPEQSHRRSDLLWSFLKMPNLSVFDREGALPVNLQRNGLQGPIPFQKELLASIGEDIASYALVSAPENCCASWFRGTHKGMRTSYEDWPAWLIAKDSFLLNEPILISKFQPKLLILAIGGSLSLEPWGSSVQRELPPDGLIAHLTPNIFEDTNSRIKSVFVDAMRGYGGVPNPLKILNYRTYVPAPLLKKVKELRPGKVVQKAMDRIERSIDTNGWKSVASSDFVSEQLNRAIQATRIDAENPTLFCILQVGVREKISGCRSLADRWMEILGKPDIPFLSADRQEMEKRVPPHVKEIIRIQRARDAKAKKDKSEIKNIEI